MASFTQVDGGERIGVLGDFRNHFGGLHQQKMEEDKLRFAELADINHMSHVFMVYQCFFPIELMG
jgi:hypothetical protein